MWSQFYRVSRTPGISGVFLNDLNGHAEMDVSGTGTPVVLRLLDHLIEGSSISAGDLVIADRDEVLAVIYSTLYGNVIDSTVYCRWCSDPFDLSFSLRDFQVHIGEGEALLDVRGQSDGTYALTDEVVFRLPTGNDELFILGLPSERKESALLERCLLKGDAGKDHEVLQQAMEQVAPLLQGSLSSRCPSCGKEQSIHFDMQSFLLQRLLLEKKNVIREVHTIASAYGWTLREILDLPRQQRKTYCSFIESERR